MKYKNMGKRSNSNEVVVSQADMMKMMEDLTFIKSKMQVHDKVFLVLSFIVVFIAFVLAIMY